MTVPPDLDAPPQPANSPANTNFSERPFPWIVLACILASYVICIAFLHPTNFFGFTEDDSIYFGSAREIAQGHGYILPHIPGTPAATKYPVLYPWILSWVWKFNPNFPANLSWAVAIDVFFGMLFLVFSFVFLRRLKGLSDRAALAITALCAVHPLVLFFSAEIMSDIPFAALLLAIAITASKAVEQRAATWRTVVCGVLSGLSVILRTAGAPFASGIFVAILLRSGWRKALVFAGTLVPSFAMLAAGSFLHKIPEVPLSSTACAGAWRMTWFYYTSYAAYWKTDTLTNHVLWPTLSGGVRDAFLQPGFYLIETELIRRGIVAFVLVLILSAIALRGIVRQVQLDAWQPIHLGLVCYLVPIVLSEYRDHSRYFIPFMPLVGAGLWIEVRNLIQQIRVLTAKQNRAGDRVAATFFIFAAGVLLSISAWSWHANLNSTFQMSRNRGVLLQNKRQAYDWLRQNTPTNARVLAFEPVTAFLYSQRQSMRSVIFSAAGATRPQILDSELACLTASAEPIGARYWIVSDDDFGIGWEPANSRGRATEIEITKSLHPLFRSDDGKVRIYGLGGDGMPLR